MICIFGLVKCKLKSFKNWVIDLSLIFMLLWTFKAQKGEKLAEIYYNSWGSQII